MLFKQIQLFQLTDALKYSPEELSEKLVPFAFTSCLPTFASSSGWVCPFIDEETGPLIHGLNGYMLICLQIEEKILPGSVIRQELNEKIKEIENRDDRKVRQKEKLSLKDEITITLLPKAFTKLTRIYAYIDTRNQWLILGTTSPSKTEQFISLFKKSFSENIHSFKFKKISSVMTGWLKNQDYPHNLAIEKACVLQDPNHQNRIIRCQEQNLFASAIQTLLKEGCEAKQLALSWQDRLHFILTDDFSIRGIKFQEELLTEINAIDAETKQQQLDADFFITTETFSLFLKDLLDLFLHEKKEENKNNKIFSKEIIIN